MGQDLWPQSDQVLASIRMFDSAHKLDYKGLPPYWCWYSQLRNSFVLTPAEYEECKRVFQERGMKTLRDWLEYYNNLDVTPFLETLEKIKAFYTKLGIDIFKDAVSLPGVSMQCILRGTLRGRDPPQLYAPSGEAYEMLKGAVVDGPSLVFTRKHSQPNSHPLPQIQISTHCTACSGL